MKALTNILNYMLLMLLLMLVACTHDDAEVENLSHGDKYVSVRMHVPGMKSSFSRAAEDNLTSIVALVFRNDVLISNTEVLDLTPNSDLTGTFKIPQPNEGDIIHFLGNLPESVKNSLPATGGTQEEVLRALTTSDDENLSYWGTAKYTSGDITVTLYRNMAKVEIKPDTTGECTFPEDSLFIAGLVKANQGGTLVPYDTVSKAFNFNLKDKDYNTLPNPRPAQYTHELPVLLKSLYLFEHDNPGTADGLFIICKIEKYYYKVALVDKNKKPYPIIRNHKYTIYVSDLDEGADSFDAAVKADPVNFEVVEVKDVVLEYNKNTPTVYLNGGASATLPVNITVPNNSKLTQLTISAPNFTIKQGETPLEQNNEGIYTYSGEMTGTTGLTFIPKSGLEAGNYPIILSGSGTYLHEFSDTITVTVDATVMGVSAKNDDATLDMDAGDTDVTFVLTKPGNVSSVSVTTNEFNYSVNNGNEYTFTPKNNNIASGKYTVTFADSNYPNVNATATITVENTPKVTFSPDESSKTMSVNDTYTVTMTVPNSGTLTALNIAAEGFTVTASSGSLFDPTDNVYSYTGGTTQFTFTPTSAGSRTIRFYNGAGVNVNVPTKEISVTVEEASGEEPGGGESGEVTVWDEGPQSLNWSNFAINADWWNDAPEGDVQLYVYFSSANQFEVRVDNNGNIGKYHDVNLNNNGFGKDPYMGNFDGLNGKLSIVIPAANREVSFYISGSITITQITVVK